MPPATPPSYGAPQPPNPSPPPNDDKTGKKGKLSFFNNVSAWDRIKSRANTIASIAALFLFLVCAGAIGGYFYSQSKKTPAPTKSPTVQTLTQSDLDKLSEIGANLGTVGQTLNIGANALFRGTAQVTGDLTVGGRLNANGPVTLSQLNITGDTAASGLNVGSNLIVSGTTTLQKALTVNSLVSVNSNLNVSGGVSASSLTANAITVHNLNISGPLTVAHLVSGGPTPFFAAGAVGSGGTVSISGNDTTGTVNVNTGGGPSADTTLMTVTFRAPYGATAHVQLSPTTSAAAQAQAYVVATSSGFRILAHTPPAGATLSFDYLVMQ